MVKTGRSLLARQAAQTAVEEFQREFHETPIIASCVILHRPSNESAFKTAGEFLDAMSPKVQ